MCRLMSLFGSFMWLITVVNSARILGVFPVPSISHQFVFRTLTHELAKRGHELVVITTDPAFTTSKPPENFTEIDISASYKEFYENILVFIPYKRGVLVDADHMSSIDTYNFFVDLFDKQMDFPDIKKLIEDKTQKFDLILAESFMNYHLIFSHIFKAPVLLMSTFHGFPENYAAVGAITQHPIFYPHVMRDNFGDLSLIDKIMELRQEYRFLRTSILYREYESAKLKAKFGPDTPTIDDLYKNIAFLFINSNEMYCNNRPLPPNAAYVGPLHLQPSKEIPQDLKSYLDNSKTGVIYVSLGTNVRPSLMDKDLLESFLKTFEALPYDILWKFDGDNLENVPKNVRIQKWFPQRDMLLHPNIKLFVTQGGLQSSDEAVDSGVPLVIIPMLGDQFYNAYKLEQLGVGVKLDALTLDANSLSAGINEVLKNNNRYRENMKKLKAIVNDHPQTPLERAIWWTEYIIRHKGAYHLRSPAANASWADFLMYDVVAVLAAAFVVLVTSLVCSFRYILKCIRNNQSDKVKNS